MQQPISLPDDSEDVPYADETGDPGQPSPEPAPFTSLDQARAPAEAPASADAPATHAVSQREMLMAEHRARAQT